MSKGEVFKTLPVRGNGLVAIVNHQLISQSIYSFIVTRYLLVNRTT